MKLNIALMIIVSMIFLIGLVGTVNAFTVADCQVGGTVILNGAYCIHTFTTNGTFNITKNITAEVLIVAGGGGGGSSPNGAGGGAGGLIYNSSYLITLNTTVSVGAGGAGGIPIDAGSSGRIGTKGGNSSFGTMIANGGGGGGSYNGLVGLSGGSSGGTANTGSPASATAGQGNIGGTGTSDRGGGGGGAFSVGGNGAGGAGGSGGTGLSYSINGSTVCYAGGGGGSVNNGGSVGNGSCGGGNGAFGSGGGVPTSATNGTDYLGSGGGGGERATITTGGSGGNGVVIIKYLVDNININSVTYNASTYETSTEIFYLNVTGTITSVNLNYDGTNYSATNNGEIYSASVTIPTVSSLINKTFYWNVNGLAIQNYQQTVNPLYFVLCNSTINTPFLNFTFLDETTLTALNASFNPLTAIYYLGDGSVTKSLLFINTTDNPKYTFCLNVNKTLYTSMTATYSGSSGGTYPTRYLYYNPTLTNSMTTKPLYLLSTGDGVPVFIQVVDANGNKVAGASITASRLISGSQVIVEQVITGADGGANFWLSPNFETTFTATKSGCSDTIVAFTPTQPQYTMTMSCGGTGQANNYFQSSITGVKWQRGPPTGQLNIASTGSLVTFTYRIDSAMNNIIQAMFTISNQTMNTNGTRLIVNSTSSLCTASGCYLSMTYFVHPGENLWGSYYVNLGNGYILLEGDANWITITNQPSSSSTVKNLLSDFAGIFSSWTVSNGEWSQTADDINKMEYSRIVFFFLIMAIVLALFSKFTGYDYANPGVFMVGLTIFMFILSSYNGMPHCSIGTFGNFNDCMSGGGTWLAGYFYYNNFMPGSYNGLEWMNNFILPIIGFLVSVGVIMGALANKRGG